MQTKRFTLSNKNAIVFVVFATFTLVFAGCNQERKKDDKRSEKAQSQVRRVAQELDKKTTETGSYVRVEEGELDEKDPWGTPLVVSYSQDGVSENLTVKSAGPDKQLHTSDDIEASGIAINFKGVGEGIKKNVGEAAANAAKGAVKGTVAGVKESIKDALPFKKKKKDSEQETKEETKSQDEKPEKPVK